MSLIVAIVGMPNVGKSTLFNRIIKSSHGNDAVIAITDKTPGVTRDRNCCDVEWREKRFTVIDTGGLYFDEDKSDDITEQVREQALTAIEEADLILHVMDGKAGINPFDTEIAKFIRESGKGFLFVANKIDTPQKADKIAEFYSLGAEIISVSALTGYGFEELMEKIITLLPTPDSISKPDAEKDDMLKIAVVGRPNVGKSTFINSLLSRKRLIVSPVPGTTRDSIDTVCTFYGKKYLFIDTAGIRKGAGRSFYNKRNVIQDKYSQKTLLERMSVMKAIKSIQRADVVLILLDASEGITAQDQKIAGMVAEYGKGAVLLLNKWDAVDHPEIAYKNITQTINRKMWFMNHVPILTISGINKKRISKIFPLIDEINLERTRILTANQLEVVLSDFSNSFQNIMPGVGDLKFTKIKQSCIAPPTFDIYTNRPSMMKDNLLIFAEKLIRSKIPFKGTPVRIFFKSR